MVDKIWYNMEELIGGSEERGINRNIVECKDLFLLHLSYPFPAGINRNIVECKVDNSDRGIDRVLVLIET